jgi:hypothetical protein
MRCKVASFLAGLVTVTAVEAGPFTPPPGIPATSVPAGNWATGFIDYLPGANVDLAGAFADPTRALDTPSGDQADVVSLGDGGSITLTFASAIFDGPGADFAVFENGFVDNSTGLVFGELGWVEVSSNGTSWLRFPGLSTSPGIGTFSGLDPTNFSGLAGTYPITPTVLGTPFDLSVFQGAADSVRYVRIVDIIGNGSVPDVIGNPIHDPSPTTSPGGGFDLSGVGVVHLAPIPEPGTYALMAAGLVVVLTIARRRRRA